MLKTSYRPTAAASPAAAETGRQPTLLTLPFLQLCFSGLLFFISFNMIIPELPAYLTSLGGEQYKGLIISLFTVTAGLSRPFSGKLTDTIGRIPVMVIGALVCVLCGLIYPIANSVFAFLTLRFFHGFSTGFKPTGTSAYVADIVPENRRGEAMGLLGFFSSSGIALGPVLGSMIASLFSIEAMFYASSVFAFLSVFILINMAETLPVRRRFSWRLLRIRRTDIYTKSVFPAAIVMVLSVYSFGVVLTIIPDFSDALQISNKGYFFACFTLASLFVRVFLGKLSDLYGREPIIAYSLLGLTVSLVFIGMADTAAKLMVGGALLGIAVGFISPAIFAWTIDLSDKRFLGRGIATMYIALEIGIGSGALFSGLIFNNHFANIKYTFWLSAAFAFLAFLYLQWYRGERRRSVMRRWQARQRRDGR